jgi:hypothetical protein
MTGKTIAPDIESDILPDNAFDDLACPEQGNMSAGPNVPELIRPARKSNSQAANVFAMVNAIATRRNQDVKNG